MSSKKVYIYISVAISIKNAITYKTLDSFTIKTYIKKTVNEEIEMPGRKKVEPAKELLLTTGEVAAIVRVSQFTIRKWARLKQIPHMKFNNQLRFDRETIKKWLKRQSQEATT